jgi:hypothetical protein
MTSARSGASASRPPSHHPLELFEVEDLDKPKARLEEFRPDPLRFPPKLSAGQKL